MTVTYINSQNLKEHFAEWQDQLNELLTNRMKDVYQLLDEDYKKDVFTTFYKMIGFIVENRQHELVLLAKERGKYGAKKDIPLVAILEILHAFRIVYWERLKTFFENVKMEKEDFFQLERSINTTFDTYIAHYFSSYIELKNEILRAHREMIDDLTVPIIPLSSSMAVLPIVGTMDTYRAKRIQERSLERIASLRTEKIIIDLSAVAFMDTAVVGHLFRLVEGINLLGCKAIITGIRPEIANTMIEMGISLAGKVETKGTLQQALEEFGLRG